MNNLTQIYNSDFPENNEDLFLHFISGDSKYALKVSQVLEIIKLPYLEYPQKLPNNVVGLLNYNNLTINVVDLRFYLNVNITPYTTANQLLIVKTDEAIFGIIVNRVEDIIVFEHDKIERMPFTGEDKLIEALYHLQDDTISVVNLYTLEKLIRQGNNDRNCNVQELFPQDDESRYKMLKRTRELADKSKFNLAKSVFSNDRFITFALNYTYYCINLSYVKEVMKNAAITQIPCAPDYIAGIMTLRGDFITVVNIKKFLDLSADTDNQNVNVIIIGAENYKMGFLVDEIFEICEISEDIISKKNYTSPQYVINEVVIDDKLYNVLDMKNVLSDERFYIECV